MTQAKRIPILATLVVLAAIAIMIALGVWQLQRAQWKEAMLARFQSAEHSAAPVAFPRDAAAVNDALYRHATLTCSKVDDWQATAGLNASGASGFAHVAQCRTPDTASGKAEVIIGWSDDPAAPQWAGGVVTGVVGPSGTDAARLVADPPLAGLVANKRPDPSSIPNNHMAYAGQWFLFALAAGVIFLLALRRRGFGSGTSYGGMDSGVGSGAGEGAGSGAGSFH